MRTSRKCSSTEEKLIDTTLSHLTSSVWVKSKPHVTVSIQHHHRAIPAKAAKPEYNHEEPLRPTQTEKHSAE